MEFDWEKLKRQSVYDVTLKGLVTAKASSFIRLLAKDALGEARFTAILSGEIPRIPKLYADLVLATDDSRLFHIEFQSTNDLDMPWRMLEYYQELSALYSAEAGRRRPEIVQCVVYVGRDTMIMGDRITHPRLSFSYECIDIRHAGDLAGYLKSSSAVDDRILALLCQGVSDDDWRNVIDLATRLPGRQARAAIFKMAVFARLRDVGVDIRRRIDEMITLDVENDPVFRPMVDELQAKNFLRCVLNFAEARELAVDDIQRASLGAADYRTLEALLQALFCAEDPQEALDRAFPPGTAPAAPIGYGGDD